MGLENMKSPTQLNLGRPRKNIIIEEGDLCLQFKEAQVGEASRLEEEIADGAKEWQVDLAQSDSSFERGVRTPVAIQGDTGEPQISVRINERRDVGKT